MPRLRRSSVTPVTRSARPKARRRSAWARQAGSRCRCAPRPGRRRDGSGTMSTRSAILTSPAGSAPPSVPPVTATTRSNSEAGARFRQPTQVRTGDARRTTEKSTPRDSARSLAAARRPPIRRVATRRSDGQPASAASESDVDPPTGEPGRKSGVLPLPADRQRQLEVRHGHPGRPGRQVDHLDPQRLGRRQRVADERSPGRPTSR